VHLEADLHETVAWAGQSGYRWAFTLSNVGSSYFQDRCDLAQLPEIDWKAVNARDWQGLRAKARGVSGGEFVPVVLGPAGRCTVDEGT